MAISYVLVKAEYQKLIDVITDDDLKKQKAQLALEKWVAFSEAADDVMDRPENSYQIMGRNFTFRSPQEARDLAKSAQAELEGYLGLGDGAGVTFVDYGGPQW